MAIKQELIYKWFTITDAYYKIMPIKIDETWDDWEWNKLYKIDVTVSCYTDDTKEHHIDQCTYAFNNILWIEFNLDTFYTKLKTLDFFSSAVDC